MKIAFFANSQIALPVYQYLLMNGMISGLCFPEKGFEGKEMFVQISQLSQVPILEVNAANFKNKAPNWIRSCQADLGLVFTFPIKIAKQVLTAIPLGFFNIHFGKLPQYRGAEPLFWQLKNCEREVVITIHKMVEQLDAGDTVVEDPVKVLPEEIYGSIQNRLAQQAVSTVAKFIQELANGKLTYTKQNPDTAKTYPKPQYEDVRIDWTQHTQQEILALVSAVNPWNKGLITYCNGVMIKLLAAGAAHIAEGQNVPAGCIVYTPDSDQLYVATSDKKVIRIESLYCQEGFYSGRTYKQQFLSQKDRFTTEVGG